MPRLAIEDRFFRQVVDALSKDKLVLPSLPEVAVRIASMMRDPDVEVARIATEISRDPGISVRLLRVANSAGQGASRRADNLRQAVTRLGLQLTRVLVSGLALEQMFFGGSPALKGHLRRCWSDSLEVGAVAQVVAAHCTKLSPEMALLAGLVHEVGALPIVKLAENHPELADDPAVLENVLAQLAPRVGRLVLNAWNFPPELVELPSTCFNFARTHDGPPDYIDVVQLAILHHGGDRVGSVDRSKVAAYARLGLDPALDLIEQLGGGTELQRQRALLAA